MRFRPKYGSHLPVLLKVMGMTSGDVLEMGGGYVSTSVMHWLCVPRKRHLLTIENDPMFYRLNLRQYECEYHKIILLEDWDEAPIEKPWDVVLIDHAPSERRIVDIVRLSNFARYIVVHDTDWRQDKHYHYSEIWPMFRYRLEYRGASPPTTLISNLVDLKGIHP